MKRLAGVGALAAVVALAALAGAQATRGVTKNEIVLGMHTDLSGPAATYGVSSSNAVKMRFDDVNAAGGIHGRKIRLIEQLLTPEDEELTPTMKLKRTFVNMKYKNLIEGMYERSEG